MIKRAPSSKPSFKRIVCVALGISTGCSVYHEGLLRGSDGAEDGDDAVTLGAGGSDSQVGGASGIDMGGESSGGAAASATGGREGGPVGGSVESSGGSSQNGSGGSGSGSAVGGAENPSGSGGSDGSGGAQTGGTGAGGGAANPCAIPEGVTVDLVDDMSLAANRILVVNGRKGDWISFHGADMDTSPSSNVSGRWPATPMSPRPEDAENYALHYTSWLLTDSPNPGAIWQHFGFLLNEGQNYDLSPYDGVLFCGRRGSSAIQSLNIRVITRPNGGTTEAELEATGKIFPSDWGLVMIPFGPDWAKTSLAYTTNFEFEGGAGVEYDVWIDDVAFYKND